MAHVPEKETIYWYQTLIHHSGPCAMRLVAGANNHKCYKHDKKRAFCDCYLLASSYVKPKLVYVSVS